jgi:antitoxin component of RelBE/YafQ-DinJ toxin-antitoxin module
MTKKEPAKPRLSTGVTIRLDPDTLEKLRAVAQEHGIGPTTLIRMWVLERLRQNEKAPRG